MISKKLQDAINAQINKELYSEYLYISMQAWFANLNLDGFANWMDAQGKEERFHAMKLFNYLIERGGKVELKAIAQPTVDFKTPLKAFDAALKHEQFVTKSINDLMDIAIKEKDHASRGMLQWFVDEQVEEEAAADRIVNRLKMIGDNPHALFMIDTELGQRVFAPPVTPA
ncbi:MAG: ferritin [Candidatus Cloacimonetes bacterium HGW-Cloacimonetes-3]|jgi:ferritin|nr:MAG: ferritin [Candidatus Cloacimonetes bacterium HGW-Cloacimonetes-3]